jgi:hypothetical protein
MKTYEIRTQCEDEAAKEQREYIGSKPLHNGEDRKHRDERNGLGMRRRHPRIRTESSNRSLLVKYTFQSY